MHVLRLLPCFLLLAFLAAPSLAQERVRDARPSPNASVTQDIGKTSATITYGRPHVKGRTVFGDLAPYDKVWRTGANEATTVTFTDDVMVEGQKLSAGTYGLFTIPGAESWTIIFNKVPNQWGAFEYDVAQDALRVTATPEEGPHMEMLQFSFEDVTNDSGKAVLHWATTRVPFTITTTG